MSETERDREIDAAWRAASREEPPPALDAAIRAEARSAASPADARRRRRRQLRYPFAAAATVALLAFGIAQMVPPNQDAMIVADQATSRFAIAPPQPDAGAPTGKLESNASPPSEPFPATSGDSGETATPLAERQPKPETPAPGGARRDETPREAYAQAQKLEESARARSIAPSQQRSLAAAPAAKVSGLDQVKAKQAGADSIEAWIARIRDLKSNGRLDEATKELAKFRAAYGERADALLPPDLRRP